MKRIQLTQGQFAIVDDADFKRVSKFKWCAKRGKGTFYAHRQVTIDGKRTSQQMHRFINKTKRGKMTDHKNGDGLDNRRENLRSCTNMVNCQNRTRINKNNTTGHAGVYWNKDTKSWRAQIRRSYKLIDLGLFKNKSDAIQARINATLSW